MKIRPARKDEDQLLSAIALQAKAHWSYPAEALRLWESQLKVTAEDVASKPTYVGEVDKVVVGFYSLAMSGQTWELDNLWILPEFMHRGMGRALLNHALDLAAQGGARSVTVDADPNAESFYLECGAIRYAAVPAPIEGQPERVRPQLRFERVRSKAG